MPNRLLGVLRLEAFELSLRILMLTIRGSGAPKCTGEFRPGVGRAHVDDPHRLNAGARGFDAEEARGLAAFYAPPEFLFRRQKQVLVERVAANLDLDPLATPSNDREHRVSGIGDPHVVLKLGHVL